MSSVFLPFSSHVNQRFKAIATQKIKNTAPKTKMAMNPGSIVDTLLRAIVYILRQPI